MRNEFSVAKNAVFRKRNAVVLNLFFSFYFDGFNRSNGKVCFIIGL
jgi:hypothetical protein